jgi:hypothetical protein
MIDSGSGAKKPSVPLHVVTDGLDFFLDAQNSLMAYTSENTGEPLKVTGFRQDESGFTLSFSGSVSVGFASEKRGDATIVSVRADIPAKYQKIIFPYKITRSAKLEKKDSLTLVNVGKKQYFFSGAVVDSSAGGSVRRLSIQRSAPVVYYQTYIPAKGLSVEEFASASGASDAEYGKAVDAFAARALLSFKESISAERYTEPVVAAYIAEMGRIGMYHAAVDSIPESWRNGSGRTWQTNTFLDNLERTWGGFVTKEKDDRSMISRKLTESNPSVFEYPSLVPYLVDRGSSILLKDVSRLAGGLDMASVTARQAAGILEASVDFAALAPDQTNVLSSLSESCERKLKASFVMAGKDLFVSDDGKTVNSLSSLEIASILIRYGSSSPDRASWKAAGHLIAESIAARTGDKGALSAQFSFIGTSGGEPQTQADRTGVAPLDDKTLDAATVYPALVTNNTWYPHVASFALDAGPGIWAWTSAQSVKVSKTGDGAIKFTTRFPQGETHYMVLRGIKPFSRIVIYGMDFHSDPSFESYNSSGYRYNEDTGTLYLKMRHKSEYEDVILYFGQAAKPAADTAAPAAQ